MDEEKRKYIDVVGLGDTLDRAGLKKGALARPVSLLNKSHDLLLSWFAD